MNKTCCLFILLRPRPHYDRFVPLRQSCSLIWGHLWRSKTPPNNTSGAWKYWIFSSSWRQIRTHHIIIMCCSNWKDCALSAASVWEGDLLHPALHDVPRASLPVQERRYVLHSQSFSFTGLSKSLKQTAALLLLTIRFAFMFKSILRFLSFMPIVQPCMICYVALPKKTMFWHLTFCFSFQLKQLTCWTFCMFETRFKKKRKKSSKPHLVTDMEGIVPFVTSWRTHFQNCIFCGATSLASSDG